MPKKPKELVRVGISGSYGGLNLGDEAILQSIMAQLRHALPAVEFTIFSRNPEDTLRRHQVAGALPVREMTPDEVLPAIEELDLLILGGGGILFDSEARIYLREVTLARQHGVPVMVYAVSAGPLEQRAVQEQVCEALNLVNAISVRDKASRKLLLEVGVKREIVVTADPALLLEPEPLAEDLIDREVPDKSRVLVGLSVREPGVAAPDLHDYDYHSMLASAADYMIDRFDADVLFIPLERDVLDLQHAHAVISKMLRPQHARVLKGQYTSGQLLTLMGRLDLAVGMRLHFLIFAAIQNVPFVSLPYSSKVNSFLDALEIKAPPIKLVNAGRLIAHIDYYWDNRRVLADKVKRLLPQLKKSAGINNEMALQLLADGGPDAPAPNPPELERS